MRGARMLASLDKSDRASRRSVRSAFIWTALATLTFTSVAYSASTSRTTRAYLFPPEGEIAERLSAVSIPSRSYTTETDTLSDLYPVGTGIKYVSKGPKTKLQKQLRLANFSCSTFPETPTSRGVQICTNDAAGYDERGCLRSWLILIDILDHKSRSSLERIRSFVRKDC